jgi:hypothetical protein
MKKIIYLAIQALSKNGKMATNAAYLTTIGKKTTPLTNAESKRIVVASFLGLLVDFMNAGSIFVKDLPKQFRSDLETIIAKIEGIETTGDWDGLNAALRTVVDQRPAIIANVISTSLDDVAPKLRDGLKASADAKMVVKTATESAKKSETLLEAIQKNFDASKVNAKQTLDTAQAAKSELSEIRRASEASRQSQDATLSHRTEALKSKKEADKAAKDANSKLESARKSDSQISLLLVEEKVEFQKHKVIRADLEKSLDETAKKARKIFFDSTTAALARQWQIKRRRSQWGMAIAGFFLTFMVLLAVCLSILLVFPSLFTNYGIPPDTLKDFSQKAMLKAFAAPPLVFAIWFLAAQFSHARTLAADAGRRETKALTLEAYRTFLTELAGGDEFRDDKVFNLFVDAIRTLYTVEEVDGNETKAPRFSLFSKKEVSIDDIVVMAEKLSKLKGNVSS